MFTLITGSFRALEESLISEVLAIKKLDPLASILLVSPSGHLLTRLQRLLTSRREGLLNIHCINFYGLAERLLAETSTGDRLVEDSALYTELIRDFLEGHDGGSLVLGDSLRASGRAIPKGLPGSLASTLRDLRDAGLRYMDALAVLKEGFLGTEALEAAPTLELYGRVYDALYKMKLRTPADLLRRAAQAVPTHPWIQSQQAIFLYGFYDLTGVQLDFVLSLASHAKAHVYFPFVENHPSYAFAEQLLKDPGFMSKVGSRQTLTTNDGGGKSEEKMRSASPLLFTPPSSAVTAVWSCSGARDEIWLAAKEILRLRDKGVAFDEIAIIGRRLDPYLPALREIFASHQIPYHSTRGAPAGSHPLIKAVRTALTLARDEYPRLTTVDLLKSPYFKKHFDVSLADPFTRRAGIVRSWPAWHDRLTYWSAHEMREVAGNQALSRHLLDLLSTLHKALGAVEETATWSEHACWAQDVLEQWIALPENAAAEERLLLKDIQETLRTLPFLDALGKKVSRERFLNAWEQKIGALELVSPTSHAGVQALEVLQARGLKFRAVFLLGLNEKSFPRLIREDPFLSDTARARLSSALGVRLSRKLDGYQEERLLFTLMRETALESLYLLTQRSNEDGKTLIPSIYLQEFLRETRARAERLPRALPPKFIHRPAAHCTPKELSYLLNRAGRPVNDLEPFYTAFGWNPERFKQLLAAHNTLEAFHKGIQAHDGLITASELIAPALANGFSPSSLEDLAECPYRFYASYVLKLRPFEDPAPEGEMTAAAMGKLFHRALELFYTAARDKGLPTDKKAFARQLEAACSACFAECRETAWSVYPVAWKAVQNLVRKHIESFLKNDLKESEDNGFTPTYFEEMITGSLTELGQGLARISFHGKPDRIDLKTEAGEIVARVIDYKSGKARELSGRLETALLKGSYLQLPIYLGLVSEFIRQKIGKNVRAESAALRWVRPESTAIVAPELLSDFFKSADAAVLSENIEGLISLAETGHYYIEPSSGEWGHCGRCDFARVCRKEHMRTRTRSEFDPVRLANRDRLSRTAEKKKK
jgi:ATP-dependent helicase/nuclease subunit B